MTYPAASESKNREQDGEVIKSMTVGTSTRAPNYKKKKKENLPSSPPSSPASTFIFVNCFEFKVLRLITMIRLKMYINSHESERDLRFHVQ